MKLHDRQEKMKSQTPPVSRQGLQEFVVAVNRAADHNFCTTDEANVAIEKYRNELLESERKTT